MVATDHPLRLWRQARGLTLNQLKQQLEVVTGQRVTPSHLSEIERGKNTPSLDLATKLSRATDGAVKVEEFVRSGAA